MAFLFTVLGNIYELLGVLAEVHPSEMVNNSDKLYKAYLGELKVQVKKHLVSNQSQHTNKNHVRIVLISFSEYLFLSFFLSDDFGHEGAEVSGRRWLSEGDHGADGELYQISGRRCV